MLSLMVCARLGSEMVVPRSSFPMDLVKNRCLIGTLPPAGEGRIYAGPGGMCSLLSSFPMFLVRHSCYSSLLSLVGVEEMHAELDGMCSL
jgi:hypothetical protein